MACFIAERAHLFDTQSQIQSEIGADFPIVLCEKRKIAGAVLVVENTAATEAAVRGALENFLEIGQTTDAQRSTFARSALRVKKEKLAVEGLREKLVEITPRECTIKTEDVCPPDPADGVQEVVIVLRLELIGRWGGTQ